ncbi:MAG: hypothetical protein Q4G02_00440 [bacterium]|nr:hypothetical protein [bacterium]
MFVRTPDNRLLFQNGRLECEILPYFSQSRLFQLKKELLLLEQVYFCEVFGNCPFIFLSPEEYRVLSLKKRYFSHAAIAKTLRLSLTQVEKLVQILQQKYQLWAHDENFKLHPDLDLVKIRVTEMNFSDLLTGEQLEELNEILPGDNGQESKNQWSKIATADILNLLTSVQKQTAILLEQGYSPEEIGARLGVSTQEVYQKIARMRARLQKAGYGPKAKQ